MLPLCAAGVSPGFGMTRATRGCSAHPSQGSWGPALAVGEGLSPLAVAELRAISSFSCWMGA